MAFRWRWILILFALVLSGEISFAANGAKEQRAYAAAVTAFQDEMWSRAETEFAQFVQKYPKSTNAPQAVLLQAQAEFQEGKLEPAIALLTSREATAGNLADQYVYWIGEAQFQNADFSAAAETFDSLSKNFPGSPLRLRAAVESASAYAQLAQWPQVEASLQETNGIFQRTAQVDSGNELVSRGRLLLAQAKFVRNDFAGSSSVLQSLNSQTLAPELDWQRAYLLCQVKLAAGDTSAALVVATNLLQIAALTKDDDLRATSIALRADVLEKMGRVDEAIAAYRENLATNAPDERQRQAVLKIAQLALAQKQFPDSEAALEKFLAQFPGSQSTDIALFTLGELHLRDYAAQPSATDHLQRATAAFDRFLGVFTNNLLTGKAYLDRGWCNWFAGKFPESFDDFKMAARWLPLSEDLAVAKFKMGDALFAQNDFSAARTNYQSVLDDFSGFAVVEKDLGMRAMYQTLRACLELKDAAGASNALVQIFQENPAGELAQSSSLLYGESLASPADARSLFEKIEPQFSGSLLQAPLELAVARTFEQETNWPAAIGRYEDWLKSFPTNSLRARAGYALAWANFQAGNETNALMLFTNFVAQFPTDGLAPQAQWWVADSFYNAGDFVNAEKSYKYIFQNTNWQGSPLVNRTNLFYPAQMMAGRAAVGRLGYSDAIGYFTGLTGDTNCPPELDVQARFDWGSALMRMDSTDTNNPLANYEQAASIFKTVCQSYPTNEWGALACGELGDCYLQLTNYDAATNAYAQVFNSSSANISARSQAQIGFGLTLEKKAAQALGDNQTKLRQLALDNYLDVFYETNLRDGEQADSFWLKKAGLQALDVMQALQEWPQMDKFFDRLEEKLPQLKDSLEKKRVALLPEKK